MKNSSFAQYLAVASRLPRLEQTAEKPLNIGFLAPLSGAAKSWGLPGLNGCRIWIDSVNAAGGLRIGTQRRYVNLVAFDCEDDPETMLQGAKKLIEEDGVQFLMTLGGEALQAIQPYINQQRVLTSTLLPSDLSPDTPYLIAPSEVHPVYAVTGVEHLCARNKPKTVALCAQDDAIGLPSLATYRAAFEVEGVEVVSEVRYAAEGEDAGRIVSEMMQDAPDVMCWCTSYKPMVHALTKAAYDVGFEGQLLSCTADGYQEMIANTSAEFMEGFTFQFPDFDDPALADQAFFFHNPRQFYLEYNKRFPGSWSAVSWEYVAILEIWKAAVERALTANSISVLAAMKQTGHVTHAFGSASWWGRELFGVDNALVGDWPVVQILDGKARIVEYGSVTDWLSAHGDVLKEEMERLGQMWFQR